MENKGYILFAVLLFFSATSFAQKATKIDIVNANSLEYDESKGKDVKQLIGDVILKHEDTYLYCDSAYLYTESNTLKAFGNVHISSTSVNIYSDVLTYDGNAKSAQMHKDVKLNDGNMHLETEHLNYNTKTHVGNYFTGGKITDPQNNLTSIIGYYYSDTKQFFFKDSVVLVNPQYTMKSDTLMYNTETEVSFFYGPTTIVSDSNFIYCENGWYDTKNDIAQFNENAYFRNNEQKLNGDSLYYNRTLGFGKAFNNITVTDTVRDIILKGNYAEYYEKDGITMMTEKALLIQDIDGDSLYLHADTLKAFFDSTRTGKFMYAYYNARFFKSDLQGVADSIYYSFKDSVISMYKVPILWTEDNQLSADTILIIMKNKQIDRMELYSSAFIISQDDTAKFNQVKGKMLTGYFVDNELKKITVNGNGETLYYVRDDDEKLIGINKAVSDKLLIYVEDREINTITFITNPEATLYPEKDLSPSDILLKGFHWEELIRPLSKEEVFY
ncbi:MAG: OstA-like protein [Bacteroidota bacterium]